MFLRRRRPRSVRVGPAPAASWSETHAKDLATYELQLLRALEQESQLWQPPALSLTAQAFLLTIALGPGSSPFARTVAAALGLTVSVLAMQQMAKHKLLASADLDHLHELEGRLGLPHMSRRQRPDGTYWREARGPQRWQAYRFWMGGLAIFGLVNAALVVVVRVAPGLFMA